MKLLQQTVLRDRYDVIVVGAGLGGMTAASLLARRGLSVLMIDRQERPGGACTSFKRKDVIFDAGVTRLSGFGDKGFKPFHFLMNELNEPIEMIAQPTLARMTIENHTMDIATDVDRFIDELVRLYPQEEQNLRAFYRDLKNWYEQIVLKNEAVVLPTEYSRSQKFRRLLPNPFKMMRLQKQLATNTLGLLKRYFHNQELIEFFDKLCLIHGYRTAAETPALEAAAVLLDDHIGGVYTPAGGAQMLPNKLEKTFERDGGETLYGVTVDEILIKNGKACGVRLEGGRELLAEQVIANATIWNLYGRLIRAENIPPGWLAWARGLAAPTPFMTLYMTVDCEALPGDIQPWQVFFENRHSVDANTLTLFINSLVDDTLAPPDTMVVTAISPNLSDWPTLGDPAYQSAAYYARKNRETQRMLDQIEQHYPGFRSHIRTLIAATPTTFDRYLLKNNGAVGGLNNQNEPETQKRLHARSDWKNLYLCGDSTALASRAPNAVVSGVGAANMALRDLRKKEYTSRKIAKSVLHFVDLPYRRRKVKPDEVLGTENSWLFAAQCQWCEEPSCVSDCPAGVDIPSFLRRVEAGNYSGAARIIRRRNLFGEVCGYDCGSDPPCERDCYRRKFNGEPVRIAELEHWVCRQAGEAGWLPVDRLPEQPRIIVVGSDPAALTCAGYLSLIGNQIDLFSEGSDLVQGVDKLIAQSDVPLDAIERDLRGILRANVRHSDVGLHFTSSPSSWMEEYNAAVVSEACVEVLSGQVWDWQGLFILKDYPGGIDSVVRAVAEGRRMAEAVDLFLS